METTRAMPAAGTGRRLADRPIVRAAAVGTGLGILLALVGLNLFGFNAGPADAITYYAAADRLNIGNPLYAISPDDNWILGSNPPYWTVPLLSPPFIAVIWRPLALLPWDVALAIWWAGAIVAIGLVIYGMLRARPIFASAALVVFALPLTFQIPTGNVNGYILLAAVATWLYARAGRDTEAGLLVAIAAGVKLTPAILLVWLVTQRRWRAVRAFGVAAIAVAIISLVGAGWENHLAYLDVIRDTQTVGTTPWSLAGLARALGMPVEVARFAPWVAIAIGSAVMVWQRHRPALTFTIAVFLMVWGSPVVNFDWLCLMLAALAPGIWPLPEARGAPGPEAASASGEAPAAGGPVPAATG